MRDEPDSGDPYHKAKQPKAQLSNGGARQQKQQKQPKKNRWPLAVFFITLCLSSFISFIADIFIEPAGLVVALAVLFALMLLGICADIVGVAVTSCQNAPLASMAARKVRGAKEALWLAQNADRMSNILNDVVGDVCSIISGTAGTAVSLRLLALMGGAFGSTAIDVVVAGAVAAITVGGKALGKSFAIKEAKSVVLTAGRLFAFFAGIPGLFRRETAR